MNEMDQWTNRMSRFTASRHVPRVASAVMHICEAYMYYGMPYRSTIPRGRGTLVARTKAKKKKKQLVRIDGAPGF